MNTWFLFRIWFGVLNYTTEDIKQNVETYVVCMAKMVTCKLQEKQKLNWHLILDKIILIVSTFCKFCFHKFNQALFICSPNAAAKALMGHPRYVRYTDRCVWHYECFSDLQTNHSSIFNTYYLLSVISAYKWRLAVTCMGPWAAVDRCHQTIKRWICSLSTVWMFTL